MHDVNTTPKGWGKSPRWTIEHIASLQGCAAHVLLVIEKKTYWHNGVPQRVTFTIDQLSEVTGKKNRAVRTALKLLLKKGLIERLQRGGRAGNDATPSVYRLIPTGENLPDGVASQPAEKCAPTGRKTLPNRQKSAALLESSKENISREHAAGGGILNGLMIKLSDKQTAEIELIISSWTGATGEAKSATVRELWGQSEKAKGPRFKFFRHLLVEDGPIRAAEKQESIDARAEQDSKRRKAQQATETAEAEQKRLDEAWSETSDENQKAWRERAMGEMPRNPTPGKKAIEGKAKRLFGEAKFADISTSIQFQPRMQSQEPPCNSSQTTTPHRQARATTPNSSKAAIASAS